MFNQIILASAITLWTLVVALFIAGFVRGFDSSVFSKKLWQQIENLEKQISNQKDLIKDLKEAFETEEEYRQSLRDDFWDFIKQNYNHSTKRVVKERTVYRPFVPGQQEEYIATEHTFKPKKKSNKNKK